MENVTIKAPALIFLGQLWICIQGEVDITHWRFLLMIASQEALLNPKSERSATITFCYKLFMQGEHTLVPSSFSSPLPWEAHRPMIRQSLLIGEPAWCCCSADCVLNPKFSALSFGYFYLLFTALKTADRAMAFISSSSSIKCNHLC